MAQRRFIVEAYEGVADRTSRSADGEAPPEACSWACRE